MNRKILFILIFVIGLAPLVLAQENMENVNKNQPAVPKDKWQILDDIEREKKDVFNKYQQDKQDFDDIFQEEKKRIRDEGGDDQQEEIRKLTKQYNKKKKKLLVDFRRSNKRLTTRENNLRGRETVDRYRNETRRKLKKYTDLPSDLNTRPPASVDTDRKYIKSKPKVTHTRRKHFKGSGHAGTSHKGSN